MQKLTFFVATMAALALGGCGQPTQVEGGSKSSTSAGVSTAEKALRKFGFSKDVKATVSFPASGMILDALMDASQIQSTGLMYRAGLPGANSAAQKFEINSDAATATAQVRAQLLTGLKVQVAAAKKTGAAILPELLAAKTDDDLIRVYRDQQLLKWLTIPAAPYRGWEIMPQLGFGKPNPKIAREVTFYLALQEACAQYSSQVLAQIAGKMTEHAWQDPAAAQAAIRKIYFSLDPDQLRSTWLAAWKQASAGGRRIINEAGGGAGSVEWSGPAGSFSGQPAGLVWQRDGQTWLGDGYIAGKKYEIGLASSMNRGMEKSSDVGSKSEAGTGGDASGKSKVQ